MYEIISKLHPAWQYDTDTNILFHLIHLKKYVQISSIHSDFDLLNMWHAFAGNTLSWQNDHLWQITLNFLYGQWQYEPDMNISFHYIHILKNHAQIVKSPQWLWHLRKVMLFCKQHAILIQWTKTLHFIIFELLIFVIFLLKLHKEAKEIIFLYSVTVTLTLGGQKLIPRKLFKIQTLVNNN